MNKQFCIYLAIIILSLSSCTKSKFWKEEETLTHLLKNDNFLKDKKCVILIPALGCGACTEQIIDFSKKEINNDLLLFIYSDLSSKTEFVFKNIKVNNRNFYKDSLSILTSKGLVENKPVVYFIKNGYINKIIKFDDSNASKIIATIKHL